MTDDAIHEHEAKYASSEHEMRLFFQLRAVLAPCIEAMILLDRLLFLLEQVCNPGLTYPMAQRVKFWGQDQWFNFITDSEFITKF